MHRGDECVLATLFKDISAKIKKRKKERIYVCVSKRKKERERELLIKL